jgi:three-Cys-motif partner protein
MTDQNLYADREQTLVKHEILRRYLERFALIVGSKWDVITYVDCFAGPWNSRSNDLADSSFAIALEQLRRARNELAKRGRPLRLRCFFLEREPGAYEQLKRFADEVTDAEVGCRNAAFEESVSDVTSFIRKGGRSSFPFVFIDPTGWSGIAIETIAPLLKTNPGEVLINFMTSFITRFLEAPQKETQASFNRLFGSDRAKQRVQAAAREDREDVAVSEYCNGLKSHGDFQYTCSAFVLDPRRDRTHFHVIYATRNAKGVEVFKETEEKAMEAMEGARADADDRRKRLRSKQRPLQFDKKSTPKSRHYESLRKRYVDRAKSVVQHLLQSRSTVGYDETWEAALAFPLVWESDLKDWVKLWRNADTLRIEGLRPRETIPKFGKGHVLVWQGQQD